MFTGIVTDIGEVMKVTARANTLSRVDIVCSYDPASIALGASICCSGICLTVVEVGEKNGRCAFAVDAAAETLRLTSAGGWQPGTKLNLERSLKAGDEVVVEGFRARDGSNNASGGKVTFADGRSVFTASNEDKAPR